MKMRKLMAVVLAVVVAISAMAISAFADTYELPLTKYTTTNTSVATLTIEVPAYASYGYANIGETLTLVLPSNLTTIEGRKVSYTLTINDITVALKSGDGTLNGVFTQTVEFGYFARDYYSDTIPAMVPQSTVVSKTTPIVITASVDVSTETNNGYSWYYNLIGGEWNSPFDSWCAYGDDQTVKDADTDKTVSTFTFPMSEAYNVLSDSEKTTWANIWVSNTENGWAICGSDWSGILEDNETEMTVTALDDYSGKTLGEDIFLVVQSEGGEDGWNATDGTINSDSVTVGTVTGKKVYSEDCWEIPYLAWYNTDGSLKSELFYYSLAGTGWVLGTNTNEDDSYTLIKNINTGNDESTVLYWDHTLLNRAIALRASQTEGSTVSVKIDLTEYNNNIYGNGAIYNAIALFKLSMSAEAVSYGSSTNSNSALWYGDGVAALYSAVASTTLVNGTTSTLTFEGIDPSLLYNDVYGVYNGSISVSLVSAASANGGSYYVEQGTGDLRYKEATLIIEIPSDDSTDVDTENPVEPGDTDEEPDDFEVEDDAPVEDNNPTTGVVLALVPMAIAAAAAVASKRR